MSVAEHKIESRENALSNIHYSSEKLYFFSRTLHEGKEITHADCLVMEGYLCEIADKLAATHEFLAMKAPATRPDSEEAGA